MKSDESFHGDGEEDHVTAMALRVKREMDDYRRSCEEKQVKPEVNKTFDEYERFCEDPQVHDEVNTIVRVATSNFDIEAVRDGELSSVVWERMPHTIALFKGKALFRTYLSRTVYHWCIDQVRREKGKPGFAPLEERAHSLPGELSLLTQLERHDYLERVIERADLSEREHDVLCLLLCDETMNEIARRYNVTPMTVGNWARRILLKLQRGIEALDQAQQKVKRATATRNDSSAA